jgi:carboxyl-terminal processing protease
VQQPFEMSDGSLVKITIAKWFTPKGENINETGIDPDIKITILDEDYEQNYDRQKEEAQKILKDFINLSSIGLTIDSYISDK